MTMMIEMIEMRRMAKQMDRNDLHDNVQFDHHENCKGYTSQHLKP